MELDPQLTQWADHSEPGCAIGLIEDDELVLNAGFGVENLAARHPITAESRFDIASEAKQFTAACILLLERERRIAIDDEIGEVLPELPEAFRRVRIEQLLHHTSGIPDFFQTLRERHGLMQACVLQDVYQVICQMRGTVFLAGAQFGYSNSNYALLALIVERIEGMSFGKVLAERVFRPLGMVNSFVQETPGAAYPRHAKGHLFDTSSGYRECWYPMYAVGGAGCLYSTVRDLARWMNGLYGGTFAGPELLKRMLEPGRLKDGLETKYGLGLDWGQCFTTPGLRIITHSGGHGGSRAILLHAPTHRFSIILLCNNHRIEHARIAMQMAVRLAMRRG